MTWLSSSGRGVSFGGFSGEHGASERAQSVERPKGIWGGRFLTKSRFFDVIVRTASFVLWAMQHRWGSSDGYATVSEAAIVNEPF